MADQTGIIIDDHEKGWARVVTNRSEACSGCETSGHGCSGCLAESKMETRVANPIAAVKGDIVRIHMEKKKLFKGLFLLYLLPVITLMAGAFTGMGLAGNIGLSETLASVLGGGIGLAAGLIFIILFDRSRYVRENMLPAIKSVVAHEGDRNLSQPNPCCGNS